MADAQIAIIDGDPTQIAVIEGDQTQIVMAPGENPAIVTAIPGPQGPAGAVAAAIDGSAALPSIAFASDTDTGLYRVGANQLGVSTGGTQRLVIDASGQIEATSLGSAASPTWTFVGDPDTGVFSPGANQIALSTNGTGRLFVNASGDVNISGRLTSSRFNTAFENNANAGTNIPLVPLSGGYSLVNLDNAGAGTNATFLRLGNVGVSPNASASWVGAYYNLNYSSNVVIYSGKKGNFTLAANNSARNAEFAQDVIIFSTGPAGTADTSERLRITSAGLVGIGASAPRTLFNIASTTGPSLTIENTSTTVTGTGTYGSVDWYGNDASTGASGIRAQILASSRGSSGECALDFGTSSTGAAIQTRMRIDSNGLVGIGTTSASANLTVNGSAATTAHGIHILRNGYTAIGRLGYQSTDGSQLWLTNNYNPTTGAADSAEGGSLNFASNGETRFLTANNERARIDSSGRLLVGTSSARANFFNGALSALFQVEGANAGNNRSSSFVYGQSNASGPIITLGKHRSDLVGGITAVIADDQIGSIAFQGSDGTDLVAGAQISAFVDGTPGADDMPGRLVFSTTSDGQASPTPRLTITSTGQVRLAGAGITFNGDTATANELDDYEEGTFTPVLNGTGTIGTGTYTLQQGRYTKIGRTVSIDIVLTWTAHTGAGTMFITGLPFGFGVGFGYRAPLAINTTGVSATVAYGDGAYSNISVPTTIAGSGTIYINGSYQV